MTTAISTITLNQLSIALNSVAELITVDSSAEEAVGKYEWINEAERLFKQAKQSAKANLEELMYAHGSESQPARIEIGDISYRIKETWEWSAVSNLEVVQAVAERGGLAAVAKCLGANCWKRTEVKAVIDDDEQYETLFVATKKTDVETGKPLRGLKVVNENFVTKKPKEVTDGR